MTKPDKQFASLIRSICSYQIQEVGVRMIRDQKVLTRTKSEYRRKRKDQKTWTTHITGNSIGVSSSALCYNVPVSPFLRCFGLAYAVEKYRRAIAGLDVKDAVPGSKFEVSRTD
jgi:hypothetical protein